MGQHARGRADLRQLWRLERARAVAQGALGTGFITVETISKTIQHLEGGIVGAIEVGEGDRVEKGQVLVRLDRTQAEAAMRRYRDQLRAVRARQAYLRATRDDLAAPPYSDWLLGQAHDPQVAELIAVTDAALAQVHAQRRGQEEILVADRQAAAGDCGAEQSGRAASPSNAVCWHSRSRTSSI